MPSSKPMQCVRGRVSRILIWLWFCWMPGALLAQMSQQAETTYQEARKLYSGEGGSQNVTQASELFAQAAALGHPAAQLKLGLMNELGIGRKVDIPEAARWYHLAASQGNAAAQARLGLILSRPLSFSSSQSGTLTLGTEVIRVPDRQAAAKWLRAAADQGYPPAQLWLADLLVTAQFDGVSNYQLRQLHGDPADWYAKAAEGGLTEATMKAAKAYFESNRHSDAYRWYLRAQAAGFQEAKNALAKLEPFLGPTDLLAGQGNIAALPTVPANVVFVEWSELVSLHNAGPQPFFAASSSNDFAALRVKAEQGNVSAQFNLALALQHDNPSFTDRVYTDEATAAGASSISTVNATRLGEAVRWYQRAAAGGHHDAEFQLAMIWIYGVVGGSNFNEAQRLLLSAAKSGHREAQYELALLLDEGFAGAVRSEEATAWFQKAADAGHLVAKQRLIERANVSGMAAKKTDRKSTDPTRLAIIPLQPALKLEADLLLAGLAGVKQFELVERSEIERVLGEQSLSAVTQGGYVKLGQLLRADGLLLLETNENAVETRLVAVESGVVLVHSETPQSTAKATEWAAGISRQLIPLEKKLRVPARDAVPISMLSLRATMLPGQDAGLDRQLTALLMHRLTRYPEIFVLERSRLDQLSREAELTSGAEQSFWGGSYLLEGSLNRDGVKAGQLGISLRLTSPGHRVKEFSESGPSDRAEEMLNGLAERVVAEVIHGVRHLEWKPLDEAKLYQADAEWAFKQQMFASAEEASETAWGLGLRTPELAMLRMQSHSRASQWQLYGGARNADGSQLEKLLLAMELYVQQTNNPAFRPGSTNQFDQWITEGCKLVSLSTDTLLRFASLPIEARRPWNAQLNRMRELARGLIGYAATNVDRADEQSTASFLRHVTYDGAAVFEQPEEAVRHLSNLIESGRYRRTIDLERPYYEERRFNLTVWNNDPNGAEILYKAYKRVLDGFEKDSRVQVREDVLLGNLILARSIYDFRHYFDTLGEFAWDQRESYAQSDKLYLLVTRLKKELDFRANKQTMADSKIINELKKVDYPALEERLRPWLSKREERLAEVKRQEAMAKQQAETDRLKKWREQVEQQKQKMEASRKSFDDTRFVKLKEVLSTTKSAIPDMYVMIPFNMTEEQAKELQPIMAEYRQKFGADFSYKILENRVSAALKQKSPMASKAGEPIYMRGGTNLPDWKSAHLPEVPIRLANAPPPSSSVFPMPPPAWQATATAPAPAPPAAQLIVDYFRVPQKLPGESNSFSATIVGAESLGDRLLLDVSRRGIYGENREYLLINPEDGGVAKAELPHDMRKRMMAASYGYGRPEERPRPARLGDFLYRNSSDGLLRYSLMTQKWELLPFSIPQDAVLTAVSPHLLAHNRKGVYLVDLGAKTVKVLASNLRRPAESPVDELPDLFRVQVSAWGADRLLWILNDKPYQLDLKSGKWSPWTPPPGFVPQCVPFSGGLLTAVGPGGPMGISGYRISASPDIPTKLFFVLGSLPQGQNTFAAFNEMREALASPQELPRWTGNVAPRSAGEMGTSLVMTERDGRLIFVHARPVQSAAAGKKIGLLAKVFVCERGLPEPLEVELLLESNSGGYNPTISPITSLHSTTNHLVFISGVSAGFWPVAWSRIESELVSQREKLKEKLAKQLTERPSDERLILIRDEKSPY